MRFVGDDAPNNAARIQRRNQFIDAGKKHGVAIEATLVFGQIILAPLRKFGMAFLDTRAQLQQPGSAMAGHRADFGHAFFGQAAAAQQGVERAAQIERGVGQRAIEIKQYGLGHKGFPVEK